uniref:NADH-ubiquinone oxidoreductase chain 6 n=1 Tax=Eucnemidae sp. 4 ACP-2013 TaxID=1434503 RepID=A0A3G4RY58_9COLE|nr:NADH dehydrogenase subunit 6 [Eucnemidae sp. 4 ACP-2013]
MLILSTTLFLMINHPMTMGMMLLIQTLIIALETGKMSFNFWFSYIMFLIMVGGMLILFIYMTSLTSNKKFNMKLKFYYMMIIIIMIMVILIPNNIESNNTFIQMNNQETFLNLLNKFINLPSNYFYLSAIIYLLITLIAIIKITNLSKSPMRMNK